MRREKIYNSFEVNNLALSVSWRVSKVGDGKACKNQIQKLLFSERAEERDALPSIQVPEPNTFQHLERIIECGVRS